MSRNQIPSSIGETRIANLEKLVDELIKERPKEAQIQMYMEAAGLTYESDPINRMNLVLAALNRAQGAMTRRKEKTDENGHGL